MGRRELIESWFVALAIAFCLTSSHTEVIARAQPHKKRVGQYSVVCINFIMVVVQNKSVCMYDIEC